MSRYTGSPVAAGLLDDWADRPERFTRVMPRDYQRVLELQAAAEETGSTPTTLIMEASRG